MSRSADIRGFFPKKTTAISSAPLAPASSDASSLNIPSSPVTPPRHPKKAPLTSNAEIKGSDDEDDDSDASLESLSAIIGKKASGPTYQRPSATTTTPTAKRIASGFHRSPLTLQQQPKHKFDFKSLVSHAKRDEATEQSAQRAEALVKAMAQTQDSKSRDEELVTGKLGEKAKKLLGEGEEDGASKGDKLAMAMDRTSGGDAGRPRCYFFQRDGPPHDVPRRPFPTRSVKGTPWSILAEAKTRPQMFIHGIPTILAQKGRELPDELFQWILDEFCIEKNIQLRGQYMNLISSCRDDTRRLVDESRLYGMLEKMGGPERPEQEQGFELTPGLEDPYPGRNWSMMGYFLELLAQMAPNLAPRSVLSAIQLLLRMSLDPVVSSVVRLRVEYSNAMTSLITALPSADQHWNTCCEKMCEYLFKGVQEASQRTIAVTALPTSPPRLIELRRRLASATLLEDPGLAAEHPDDSVTMTNIFSILTEPDLQIDHSTNFLEFTARLNCLDIVLDNGVHLRPSPASSPNTPKTGPSSLPFAKRSASAKSTGPRSTASSSSSAAAAAAVAGGADQARGPSARESFDEQVDRLTRHLKTLHDRISSGDGAQLKREAKIQLDGMRKRLEQTVRSRPPAKQSYFGGGADDERRAREQEDKARSFMSRWRDGRTRAGVDGLVASVEADGVP